MSELIESSENFHRAFDKLKSGNFELKDGDIVIRTAGILGEGGSKTVYDAEIGEDKFALALPNIADNAIIAEQKWNAVLKEPEKTSVVRDLGLRTNPVCTVKEITLDDVPIQVLCMKRYQDLPFEVRDRKNRRSSIINTRIIPENGVCAEELEFLLGDLIVDIQVLITNGIQLGSDSFNIAIDNGQVRLYLNDLGSAHIELFKNEDLPRICKVYSSYAVSAFIESLTDEEYNKSKVLLDKISDLNSEFERKLAERILENVSNTDLNSSENNLNSI